MQMLKLNVEFAVGAEPNVTSEDKEAVIKQLILDQLSPIAITYDYGIKIAGTLESTATETATISYEQPDYVAP